jgi:hypothetical protein
MKSRENESPIKKLSLSREAIKVLRVQTSVKTGNITNTSTGSVVIPSISASGQPSLSYKAYCW